jgi:4-hydroxy-tetrahydrodipicolinate synthase
MSDLRNQFQGLWLPLVTPFRNGELDVPSLRRLVRHYADGPVDGLILAATSGEGMSLDIAELERLVETVRAELNDIGRALPLCLGLSGASTGKMRHALDETAAWPIDGYLIASPYYTRPSQRGLVQHFTALADHAAWPIVLYNIPYRTAVNLANDTLLRLAEHPNIVGMKDCSADRAQSVDFLARRPPGFRVLTGEDAQYFDALTDGADGAILLSCDRNVCVGADAAEAGRSRRGAGGMEEHFRTDQVAVRRTEPVAGEIRAGAKWIDRQRRGSPADG